MQALIHCPSLALLRMDGCSGLCSLHIWSSQLADLDLSGSKVGYLAHGQYSCVLRSICTLLDCKAGLQVHAERTLAPWTALPIVDGIQQ